MPIQKNRLMRNAGLGAARWGSALAAMIGVLALGPGCGTFRGLPSHGGGKRFDEEQRVVAGAGVTPGLEYLTYIAPAWATEQFLSAKEMRCTAPA